MIGVGALTGEFTDGAGPEVEVWFVLSLQVSEYLVSSWSRHLLTLLTGEAALRVCVSD